MAYLMRSLRYGSNWKCGAYPTTVVQGIPTQGFTHKLRGSLTFIRSLASTGQGASARGGGENAPNPKHALHAIPYRTIISFLQVLF